MGATSAARSRCDWTQIAAEQGYVDQAHLIHEFCTSPAHAGAYHMSRDYSQRQHERLQSASRVTWAWTTVGMYMTVNGPIAISRSGYVKINRFGYWNTPSSR